MKIGLLGFGTIGSGVYEHASRRSDITVKRILDIVSHPGLEDIETTDFNDILNDPEIDTVVELISAVPPAYDFVMKSIRAGKNVVTANKQMFALYMEEILDAAREHNVHVRYDATVGGSIPYLYNVMRHRSADTIVGVSGIVNGTTNLILDTMQTSTRGFDEVLKDAQAAGYAEANPSSDIDGIDPACKICIASAVAYQKYIHYDDVDVEGIRNITGDDILQFKKMDKVCRLIVQSHLVNVDVISACVEPTLVSPVSTEAAIHQNNNSISVYGNYFGVQHFQGQGAGKDPTAFAVIMGLVDIQDNVSGKLNPIPEGYATVDNSTLVHPYYLRTSAEVTVPAKKIAEFNGATAYITDPMSVKDMHAYADILRKDDPSLFFAGIRD